MFTGCSFTHTSLSAVAGSMNNFTEQLDTDSSLKFMSLILPEKTHINTDCLTFREPSIISL